MSVAEINKKPDPFNTLCCCLMSVLALNIPQAACDSVSVCIVHITRFVKRLECVNIESVSVRAGADDGT